MTALIDLVASLNDTNLNHRVFRFLFPRDRYSPGTERATYTTVCVLRVLLYLEYPVPELMVRAKGSVWDEAPSGKERFPGECFLLWTLRTPPITAHDGQRDVVPGG